MFELKTEHKAKIMSFHSSLYKMHLNNSLEDRYWIFSHFFAYYLCLYHFSSYSQFLWKERDQNFRQRAQGKEKNQPKTNQILNYPLRFSFYISEKTRKVVIVSNFVQDLVPVKYCLTSASHSNIMVYLF